MIENVVTISWIAAYLLGFVLSTAVMTAWLHESRKEELGGSWLGAFMIGAFISVVWPVALLFLHMTVRAEKLPEDKKT